MRICFWPLLTLCVFIMDCFSQENNPALLSEEDRLERLKLDFTKTEELIYNELSVYGLHKDISRIKRWETENKIEYRIIDGEKRYFKNAISNLFRLDPDAFAVKKSVDSLLCEDVWVRVPRETATRMIEDKCSDGTLFAKRNFEITYAVTIPVCNLTNDDILLKCWLPAPQLYLTRQKDVLFLSDSGQVEQNMMLNANHASVYKEEPVSFLSESIVFETKYMISCYAQHYSLSYLFNKEKKQNKDNDTYRYFTKERQKHIIFTPRIRMLGDSLKDAKSDVQTIKNIFDYISANIPWCSALEYTNIENIPMYVLENKHGDCGQVSLLFITLCRFCGIPAKWQSGWMLHPGAENLHDWSEVYIEGVGWIPVDVSFGKIEHPDMDVVYFYLGGIDSYRFVINEDFSSEFNPEKRFFRSEPVDFQRGEVETNRRNLYFNKWKYKMCVKNIPL